MMEVRMREDPVDPPAHRPKFGHGRLLDGDPAGEILVAVEEAGGSVQGVAGVVYCRTLLWSLVGRAEKDPLFCGRHLRACFWFTFALQLDRETVQLHAELSEVLVLPHSLVLRLRGREDSLHILWTRSDSLLNVLLHSEGGVHFFKRLLFPLGIVGRLSDLVHKMWRLS